MQRSIALTESQRRQLADHADRFSPNEGCALLFGRQDDKAVTVEEIFLADNVEESPVRFAISSEELLKGYGIAEEKNLEVVGIFHSHPDSEAVPSTTDRRFMHINPVVWVIYSGEDRDFRAYLLGSEIEEIPIT